MVEEYKLLNCLYTWGALLRLKPSRIIRLIEVNLAPRHAKLFIHTALLCKIGRIEKLEKINYC
jgi:hypothetical protein